MTEPERKRRRPPISCTLCRSRKIRCDKETPCSNCVKSRHGTCVYEKQPPNKIPRIQNGLQEPTSPHYPTPTSSASRASTVLSHSPAALETSSIRTSTLPSHSFPRDSELLAGRKLDDELVIPSQRSLQTHFAPLGGNGETSKSYLSGTCTIYKTRMYGQSHWMNSIKLFQDMFQGIGPHIQEEKLKAFSGIQRCKALAKVIKAQRAPTWPSVAKLDLPPKDVADGLVECYLRTSESLYRVLHIPSFRRDYDALWIDNPEPNPAFLIQVKLVFAVGAITYDDHFSLRTSAIHWVHEAQNWLAKPDFKSRLNIQSLQTEILLVLARETVNVGGELVWISAGALFRAAVCMGLHRDPTNLSKRTPLVTEMSRRLWNTILEIVLQHSLISGSPPFFSLQDFDTEPPRNFDDDQFLGEDPAPKPETNFTQSSIAVAFRKTFPSRLAIVKFLNDLGTSGTYEETLRLDANLRASYKILRQTLQVYKSNALTPPSQFQIRSLDMIINHNLCSLHVPFLDRAIHNTTYAYTRKVILETILKVWCSAYPSSSTHTAISPSLDDLSCFTLCGSGFFRTAAFQASHLMVVTLKTQLQEEESTGPVPLRPDLLSVLKDVKTWCLRMIRAGETNIKCYLLMSIVVKQLGTRMQDRDRSEDEPAGSVSLMMKATEEAEKVCLEILKETAARGGQVDGTVEGLEEESSGLGIASGIDNMAMNIPSEAMQDCDFMTSDALFNFDDTEPMGWLFGNGNTEWSALW
ncbi:putative C6 transcription factor [Hyaloscypha variabilis F]|uniref:Putative C6 transcription factor n=1 Tax=Hyaloscypha variabilis (strain UAMH 11265 / GT02V1 / F) TaxID=1149755 RepID=A0A2J6RWN9_HYAVF|nr:putative C6 transcription factor [Hyaloscypha variabilis F]